jgi:hydroxymethylglutaryl-CoA reductase
MVFLPFESKSLALGTVGGLFISIGKIISRNAGKTIQRINAVCSCGGLAQTFALRSLTTTGIQEGHMKMHLNNIINQFEATDAERLDSETFQKIP